jgi:putative membrane protein
MVFFVMLLILALLIAVLAVFFALQNPTVVPISFLIWHFEGSVALVLLAAYLLGAVSVVLVLLPGIVRRGRKIAVQNKKIKELAKTLPVDEEKED